MKKAFLVIVLVVACFVFTGLAASAQFRDTKVDRLVVDGVPVIDSTGNRGVLNIGGISAEPTVNKIGFYTENVERASVSSGGLQASVFSTEDFTTGDLHLRKGNFAWTIYEATDGLYLRNDRTAKIYRFVLQEVQ